MSWLKRVGMLVVALACIVVIAGCAGQGYLKDEVDDATGSYKITASDAAKDSSIGSLGGGISIKDGQKLLVSPDLEKGSLQVRLLDAGSETVLDVEASGSAASTHELAPGDYSIGVTCNEDGTTGTLLVAPTE